MHLLCINLRLMDFHFFSCIDGLNLIFKHKIIKHILNKEGIEQGLTEIGTLIRNIIM